MRLLAGLLLALWLVGVLWLTVLPAHPFPGQVVHGNLIPFRTLRIYVENLGSWFWMRNLLGNLGLLLPLGLLGPIALPALGRWWRIALLALLISSAIELTQLAVPDRSADIDDVIVNVAGALIGLLTYRAGRRMFTHREPIRMRIDWGEDSSVLVNSQEDLARLLNDLARAHASKPTIAELISVKGDRLSLGVGSEESVLSWVPAGGDPPYFASKGDAEAQGTVVFFFRGSWSEFPRWSAVSVRVAREAARHFLLTGERPSNVEWVEV